MPRFWPGVLRSHWNLDPLHRSQHFLLLSWYNHLPHGPYDVVALHSLPREDYEKTAAKGTLITSALYIHQGRLLTSKDDSISSTVRTLAAMEFMVNLQNGFDELKPSLFGTSGYVRPLLQLASPSFCLSLCAGVTNGTI